MSSQRKFTFAISSPDEFLVTQENYVADFLQAKCYFTGKTAFLRFEPPLGDLWATYDDHLRLIGKRVGDFLLVLIEFFS